MKKIYIVSCVAIVVMCSVPSAPIVYEARAAEDGGRVVLLAVAKRWERDAIVAEIVRNLPPVFVKIAECESGLNPLAHNKVTDDRGLLQVSAYFWGDYYESAGLDVFNVEDNIKIAAHIYSIQGLGAWDASRECWE